MRPPHSFGGNIFSKSITSRKRPNFHWGKSWAAQDRATQMLSNLREECWKYYLNDCLPSDEIILEKLTDSNIAARWNELVAEYGLYKIELNHKEIIKLVQSGAKDKAAQVTTLARGLLTKLTMK